MTSLALGEASQSYCPISCLSSIRVGFVNMQAGPWAVMLTTTPVETPTEKRRMEFLLRLVPYCQVCRVNFAPNLFCKEGGRLGYVTLQEFRCKFVTSSLP
ncbi:hypothetical protein AVEN_142531-1 [Araneus ventricosus]|uniref:Uncharacterized protein n=1 Tax=Araneus ventricosus TaxID=182803 RepID=A0A4Y2CHL5_ARAVE|nr:hypothetical protein AVEN_142531-1 [Araneus ventricosus]